MNKTISALTKHIWVFPLAALVALIVGELCTTTCDYLRGDFLGVDLNIIGYAFYGTLLTMAFFRSRPVRTALAVLVAVGFGAELVFVAYQVRMDTYCVRCLVSGTFLVLMFLCTIGMIRKWATAGLVATGVLVTMAFFSGTVTPMYAQDQKFPQFGNLKNPQFTMVIYSDYFCPACREAEPDIVDAVRKFRQKAKIYFIDVPIHRETVPYARAFLYVFFAVDSDLDTIIRARELLFEASRNKLDEKSMMQMLEKNKIPMKQDQARATHVFRNFYNHMTSGENLKGTPTLVVLDDRGKKSYSGPKEIREAFATLSKK